MPLTYLGGLRLRHLRAVGKDDAIAGDVEDLGHVPAVPGQRLLLRTGPSRVGSFSGLQRLEYLWTRRPKRFSGFDIWRISWDLVLTRMGPRDRPTDICTAETILMKVNDPAVPPPARDA